MDARTVRHPAALLVKLDVIGKLVTLSEREAEELRAAAAAEAGRSSARRDLSLLHRCERWERRGPSGRCGRVGKRPSARRLADPPVELERLQARGSAKGTRGV